MPVEGRDAESDCDESAEDDYYDDGRIDLAIAAARAYIFHAGVTIYGYPYLQENGYLPRVNENWGKPGPLRKRITELGPRATPEYQTIATELCYDDKIFFIAFIHRAPHPVSRNSPTVPRCLTIRFR
ncbi:uncharacterized protein BO97DRAFT_413342 [Aspergillus homomorphus CBS 101889]|uniref:Uncharacterized protein n=1 Tax=Aspergillus homomorphus (strain CBS 101889) TaxID=1450537 RepID=A0A395I0L6_ASPHC|nr:hypothetical protein BO97DRAFT_413342 [Aspergillus homomorphus CBS 101889]RAL13336.1 hypothetical protein BO97DRAFT_413342 [Aspergillus homomorphus CBS 101889]